jgi:predicted  nucleic acid-binding Zn-ribbon protein
MDSVLDLLVKIQSLDDEIKENEAQLARIPQEIAKLEKQIKTREDDLKTAETRIQELKKNYKLKELEIADNEEKTGKLNTQTFAVKTNEEYRAILNEVDFLKKRNREIEDEVIGLMEEEEKLKNSIDKIRAETKEFRDITLGKITEMNKKSEMLAERQKMARAEFQDDFAKLPEDARDLYTRITKVRDKAVCPIVDNTCTGCFANLTHQFLNELKQRNKILLCDNCGRILVYTNSRT